MPIRRYPHCAGWRVQNGTTGPISEDFRHTKHLCFSYDTGMTHRLTCQVGEWEPVLKYKASPSAFCTPDATADVSADRDGKPIDEPVRWVTKAEAAEELEISLSTLDRKIRRGEVEVVREGYRVYVRMHGLEHLSDEELLRRAIARGDELQRTVRELERDEARESASASRRPYEELEEEYRKECAEHEETKELFNMARVTAIVLLVLLVVSVLVWWFVLR